jgi:hypothetical protein
MSPESCPECPEGLLHLGPVAKRRQWLQHVNRVETKGELQRLRHSVNRGTPFRSDQWAASTAATLGLDSSLRPRGRPRKKEECPCATYASRSSRCWSTELTLSLMEKARHWSWPA